MTDDSPHLNDLEEGLVKLAGLASATYWLGRADADPERQAVRVLGECLEEVASELQRKYDRLYQAWRAQR